MKTIFIGIDVSKEWLDAAICKDLNQKEMEVFRVENSLNGIEKMLRKCKKAGQDLWFCFEHTGNYGLLLASQLQAAGLVYSVVPALEIIRSQGLVRGKTDKIDAERIAKYAATQSHKLKPFQLPGQELLKLKSLLTYRSQLVSMSVQFQNSRKSFLEQKKSIDVSLILANIEQNLEQIKTNIDQVEKEIQLIIQADDQMSTNYKKTTSVKGVGPIIAAYMLVFTSNFTSFDNPRKFNCYAGLAPFEYSSGSSIRGKTRTSRLRNKTMKTLLFSGANVAASFDKELKKYYNRKKQEGKPHHLIINNIACKLVYRIFAVVKRDEPYVVLSH